MADEDRNPEVDGFKTQEDLDAHRPAGIFGDTDTSGAGASAAEVPSKDDNQATREVAKADASDEDVSVDEARRQPDVDAGTVPSAEEADEKATDQPEKEEDKPKSTTTKKRKS